MLLPHCWQAEQHELLLCWHLPQAVLQATWRVSTKVCHPFGLLEQLHLQYEAVLRQTPASRVSPSVTGHSGVLLVTHHPACEKQLLDGVKPHLVLCTVLQLKLLQ